MLHQISQVFLIPLLRSDLERKELEEASHGFAPLRVGYDVLLLAGPQVVRLRWSRQQVHVLQRERIQL